MGVVSGAALEGGGEVTGMIIYLSQVHKWIAWTGVVPYAMVKDDKDVKKDEDLKNFVFLSENGRDKVSY